MTGSDDSSSEDDCYGPALPPNFKKSDPEIKGPIGPALPPHLLKPTETSKVTEKDKVAKNTTPAIGPVLPPGMKNTLGPEIPDQLKLSTRAYEDDGDNHHEDEDEDDSDSEIIGPLPPDHPKAIAAAARAALGLGPGRNNDKGSKKLQREEWMLIPPRNKPVTELGLGPRKFQTRAPAEPVLEGDDAVDSDEEFERRTHAEMDQQIIDQYDKSMEAMKDKVGGGKRDNDSLLEIHQKEMKKKKMEEAEKKERRPFDRDTDLSTAKLSGEDRKKYIEKSRELNTRFSAGRQKFL